jgi:Outer membrane lipoprotein-sorting protein
MRYDDEARMTNGANDEFPMSNVEGMAKPETRIIKRKVRVGRSSFERSSLFRHSSFAIRHFALVVSLLMRLSAHAQPAPSAKEILASVRMMEARQQIDLQGQLRQDNVVVPFHLVQNGPLIRYSFTNPDEVLQLRLGENSSRLDLVTGGDAEQFSASKLKQKIRGTNVTYEDLAFKFLYWPTARVLGEENVRTRNCWKLQLRAPSRESQYSNVLLWIDKASGALMRMEGYDWNAQLAKRFEVVSAQKIEGRWFLKQMRVEELQPGTNHVLSRTYLEIKK